MQLARARPPKRPPPQAHREPAMTRWKEVIWAAVRRAASAKGNNWFIHFLLLLFSSLFRVILQ
jgi:hypothetical protein